MLIVSTPKKDPRSDCKHKRSARAINRQAVYAIGERQQRGKNLMQVLVRDNNVDQALRALKRKMQREGVFREMKIRRHYEKPSERRAREKAEAIRRARKLARKRLQREGLLPMKPRTIAGASGRGGPPRAARF
jgi:small subunit ribosomal protein S21